MGYVNKRQYNLERYQSARTSAQNARARARSLFRMGNTAEAATELEIASHYEAKSYWHGIIAFAMSEHPPL